MPSPLRCAALVAAAAGIAAPPLRRRLGLSRPVVSGLAWQAPVSLAVAMPPSRLRHAAVYAVQMWAYIAHYDMPNDDPEELRWRVRVTYPIRADSAVGLGETPTVRLQRALGREGEVRTHDTVLSCVHWAWYFVPHASVAYVLLLRPAQLPRSAGTMAAVFDLGLIGYWALPTAPPWWAGQNGAMPHVRRIMVEAGERFWGRGWQRLYDALAGNPFAAMPSLHFATSATAARVLSEVGPVSGALGWAYAGTLGFALVYLGEHYVVDLLAGLALSEFVVRLAPRVAPAIGAVAEPIRRLSIEAGR